MEDYRKSIFHEYIWTEWQQTDCNRSLATGEDWMFKKVSYFEVCWQVILQQTQEVLRWLKKKKKDNNKFIVPWFKTKYLKSLKAPVYGGRFPAENLQLHLGNSSKAQRIKFPVQTWLKYTHWKPIRMEEKDLYRQSLCMPYTCLLSAYYRSVWMLFDCFSAKQLRSIWGEHHGG